MGQRRTKPVEQLAPAVSTPSLFRVRAATVLIAPERTRVLIPPDRLLTFKGNDADIARRLLEIASAGTPPPEAGTRKALVAAALLEHGALVELDTDLGPEPERKPRVRLLFGVTPCIEAARAISYLTELRATGRFETVVALAGGAGEFVNAQGLRWLLNAPVHDSLFDGQTADHAALGNWADVTAVLPAGADYLARLAKGRYSDVLSGAIAASRGKVVLFATEGAVESSVLDDLQAEGFDIVRTRGLEPWDLPAILDAIADGREPALPEPLPPPRDVPARTLRVVYGISGAISSVAAPVFLDELRAAGDFHLRIVTTEAARHMVSEAGLRALYDTPDAPGDDPAALAAWADAVIVLPATAEFVCRLADSDRSDLLAATAAAAKQLVLVPATNSRMWARRAVQRAVDALGAGGAHVVLPRGGRELASGEMGSGIGGAGVDVRSLPGLLRFVTR